MNIFIISLRRKECVKMMCDQHVVKMILEYAQILSTTHRLCVSSEDDLYYLDEIEIYKATHINHPCTIWTRRSFRNYKWLVGLFEETMKEYTYRYGKIHKCQKYLEFFKTNIPETLPITENITPFAIAMPEELRLRFGDPKEDYKFAKSFQDAVDAYIEYYKTKLSFARWNKNRPKPTMVY